MLDLAEIRQKLADRKLAVVAKATGLTYMTLYRLKEGIERNPTLNTMQKVSDYLKNI
jgi:DNA-binding phage protein